MMRDKEALLREMRQLKKSDQTGGALAWWGTLSDEEWGLVMEAMSDIISRVTGAMDTMRSAVLPFAAALSRIAESFADSLSVTERDGL